MAIAGDAGTYAAATAAIAGHCFPVWTRFRGGKGVATAGGSFAVVFPPMFFIGGLTAAGTAATTRDAGRAISVTAVVWVVAAVLWSVADLSNWWGPEASAGLVAYAVVGAAIVFVRFRAAAGVGGSSR
jgi:glycerol-3-phosphate acyltransferase PlsY